MKYVNKGNKAGIGYDWYQTSVFIRQTSTKQFVLFIDCPRLVVDQILKTHIFVATRTSRLLTKSHHDPFIWHAILVEAMKLIYDGVVWSLRDFVRDWEKKRDETPNFPLLHDFGRHLIHNKETLEVAVDTIHSIMHHHSQFNDRNKPIDATETADHDRENPQKVYISIQDNLFISEKDIQAIKARALTLDERLRNEINLAYHVVTQNSTQVSIDLAKIARRDNATMKALALIGVFYLPGTFISGIFGSNFFNYNPSNGANTGSATDWKMSDKFWIYWAITIPVTMFTVLLWAMLDETMEMYEILISRVKTALFKGQFPLAKRRPTDEEDKQAGGGDGAVEWHV